MPAILCHEGRRELWHLFHHQPHYMPARNGRARFGSKIAGGNPPVTATNLQPCPVIPRTTFALFAGVSRLVCVPPPPPFPCSQLHRTLKLTFKFATEEERERRPRRTATDEESKERGNSKATLHPTWQFKGHTQLKFKDKKNQLPGNSKAKTSNCLLYLQRKGPGWVDMQVANRPWPGPLPP